MRTIVCSAGTSIAKGKRYAGEVETYKESVAADVRSLRRRHADAGNMDAFRREVCAEINSLRALGASASDTVVLLHTDTPDGEACAQVLASLVEEEFQASAQLRKIRGLQVTDAALFRREGVKSLFTELDRLERDHPEGMLLNGTGGFKSVVPYLTLFGLLRRVPVTYLFEYSEQLITLPAVPITYDYERVGQALDALRILEQKTAMTRTEFWKLVGIDFAEREYYECLLDDDGENVFPSAFALLLLSTGTLLDKVLVSKAARKVYDESKAVVRDQYTFILQRIAEPLNRGSHIHTFSGTDLQVYKPGNTSERAAYYVQGRSVYVCALAQHDTYERTFSDLKRKACEATMEFEPWSRPATDPEPQDTEIGQITKLRREVEAWQGLAEESQKETEEVTSRHDAQLAVAEKRGNELASLNEKLVREQAAMAALERVREGERRVHERLAAEFKEIDDGRVSMGLRLVRGFLRRAVKKVRRRPAADSR